MRDRRRRLRRSMLAACAVMPLHAIARRASAAGDERWYEAALRQKQRAEADGDQPYGAVLVLDDRLVGEAPSRVVSRGDPTAHAEREAIRDAQRRLGRTDLSGSVLYATSRPCAQCELAAAEARVARMIVGPELVDAGRPRV